MMKEPQLLETAIFIACKAHQGQNDKGGQPYILHPLRLMNSLATLDEKIVAVLHDTIEDSHNAQ
jgi:guanosine-3',5'-bis(diphosphate) 3'-pyrophosphohydrolase